MLKDRCKSVAVVVHGVNEDTGRVWCDMRVRRAKFRSGVAPQHAPSSCRRTLGPAAVQRLHRQGRARGAEKMYSGD